MTIIQIHPEDVKTVKWADDHKTYDTALLALGNGRYNKFLVVNPLVNTLYSQADTPLYYIDEEFPETNRCIIWVYKGLWIAKLFTKNWTPAVEYLVIEITPPTTKWSRNNAIGSSIHFKNDPTDRFNIVSSDSLYLLTWYLDPKFNKTPDKIWAIKHKPVNRRIIGVKDMGYVTPRLPKQLDVIFISYNESNAEANWQRVLEKDPWAKRVDGVEGIFNAHKAAATLATTDMFYVVDGDAWLTDEWNFDFQPSIFDRSVTHIWRAKNPINGLTYGYGGVKLFSKQVVDSTNSWTTLDMSTTLTPEIKIVSAVSNVTAFNTDEFSTWRSAFRESAKLCYNIKQNPLDMSSQTRLDKWLTSNNNSEFASYSIAGAKDAIEWVAECNYDIEQLKSINSREWLKEMFNNRQQ